MSTLDSILWDIEDYAGRVANVVKLAGQAVILVTRAYPFIVGGLLLSLSSFGIWLDSSTPAQTVQQQIVSHNVPGGTKFWMMQAAGYNDAGIFSIGSSKKQEADFISAVRFCTAHKGFYGCQRVINAANSSL